jgi:hypothetical protein
VGNASGSLCRRLGRGENGTRLLNTNGAALWISAAPDKVSEDGRVERKIIVLVLDNTGTRTYK